MGNTGFGDEGGSGEPTFDIVLPDERSDQVEDRIFFDSDLGVASFRDAIRGSEVTISQQPLTDEQKADREGQLEIIALQLLAETSFDSKFGTVYVSNTSPDGTPSQVTMFTTDELLIFIRTSGNALSVDAWAEYIQRIEA